MAFIEINYTDNCELLHLLLKNNLKLDKIMASIQELNTKVDQLQVALDAEQEQIQELLNTNAAVIVALRDTIASLEAQVADGGTPEERQAILDKLQVAVEDLEATVTPEETTTTEAV